MQALSVLSYINYYLARIMKRPDLDFLDMGLGIQARYNRCEVYWQSHIRNCKEIQKQLFEKLPGGSKISVLGAGRCLDLNLQAAAEFGQRLRFFDADRGCLPYWRVLRKKYQVDLQWQICELSNCLYSWTESLNSFLSDPAQRNIQSLISFFRTLQTSAPAEIGKADAVISLNILSQLPIFWRDRLRSIIETKTELKTDERGRFAEPLESAVEHSYGMLQEQHLRLLAAIEAEWILIFYDRHFDYLRADHYAWQQEKSLYISEDQICIRGFSVYHQKSWFWDIAPQGVEQSEYSQVHKVESLLLKREY